jgi:membrane protease subunit HflC
MNQKMPFLAIIVALVLFIGNNAVYVIKETERAVKLRFGRIVAADITPGLYLKIPFAEDVRKFDARVLTLDAEPESYLTAEKKRVIVDAFAKWRIADVAMYYRATGGDETVAHSRLADRVNDGLRNQFGVRTLHEVVSGERDLLMANIADGLNKTVRESLGIEVVDVRVKRIDLPTEVSEQVFRRMKAEREKEARELRSKGIEAGERIRADADRQQVILMANANKEAEQVRGEGDARATAIYSAAFQKDPEFYAFTRRLAAYRATFANKSDVMLLEPDSDFFRYLKNPKAQ